MEAEARAKAKAAAEKAEEAKKAAEAEAARIKKEAEQVPSPRSTAVDPIEDKAQSESSFTCGCIVC